jgi:hypothetical protein
MQSVSWPQNQGTLCGEADAGDSTPSLRYYTFVDVDVCVSVAARDHVAGNARREIKSVYGKQSATKHTEPQSANSRIWNSVVRESMNSWTI